MFWSQSQRKRYKGSCQFIIKPQLSVCSWNDLYFQGHRTQILNVFKYMSGMLVSFSIYPTIICNGDAVPLGGSPQKGCSKVQKKDKNDSIRRWTSHNLVFIENSESIEPAFIGFFPHKCAREAHHVYYWQIGNQSMTFN